jgi:hypothetical protein
LHFLKGQQDLIHDKVYIKESKPDDIHVMFEQEFTTDKKKLNRIYIQKASDEELGWLKNVISCELLDRATKRKEEVRPQS